MRSAQACLDAAVEALDRAGSVSILCHVQPDADTIGSGLALAQVLHRRGVPVQVSFAEPAELPLALRSLPGQQHLVSPGEVSGQADLVVAVDCGSADRLGALADRLSGATSSLVIDHHRSGGGFGSIELLDETAASTTVLITRLLDAWGEPIDRDTAHCLFAGLVTDTGSFRWSRPGCHTLAERLLDTGIDGTAITQTLLDTHPFAWLPMLSTVLGAARLEPGAAGVGLVYTVVRAADAAGVGPAEVESIIDVVRTTSEAGIAAVFKERAGYPEQWTVSLRSRDSTPTGDSPVTAGVDVSAVAVRFGGGGHRFAAGYTAYGSADDVIGNLVAALD